MHYFSSFDSLDICINELLCTFLQFNALFCLRVTTYIHTFVYLLDKTYSFPKAEKKISYCIMCSVALIPSRSQNLKLFATANDRCNREIESENKSAIYSGMQHILKNSEFLNALLISKEVFYKKIMVSTYIYPKVRNLSSKQSMI